MANTQISTMLATTAALALAACGGGSSLNNKEITTTGSSTNMLFHIEKVFSDGSAFVEANANDGTHALIITPNASFVTSTAMQDERDMLDEEITDAGIAESVIIGYDSDNLYFATLYVKGPELTQTPVGNHSYMGFIISQQRGASLDGDGTFSLTANFDENQFEFSGETLAGLLVADGAIDVATGAFLSNNANLVTNIEELPIQMYGKFYGRAASEVGGLFFSDEDIPSIIGGFFGSAR